MNQQLENLHYCRRQSTTLWRIYLISLKKLGFLLVDYTVKIANSETNEINNLRDRFASLKSPLSHPHSCQWGGV